MNLSPEGRQAFRENSRFLDEFRNALAEVVKPLDALRTLDYGSGASPSLFGFFAGLHSKERVTAFDPEADVAAVALLNEAVLPLLRNLRKDLELVRWTNQPPEADFDLVICNFSIHHMKRSPQEVIESLRTYQPRLVAIAEYDYTKATRKEFERTFIADAEKGELDRLFAGDVAACFDFHSRFGGADFSQALTSQGFRITHRGVGQGYAAYKIFLVGEAI